MIMEIQTWEWTLNDIYLLNRKYKNIKNENVFTLLVAIFGLYLKIKYSYC